MEQNKADTNFSLNEQSIILDNNNDETPVISSFVKLEIKERDIRCMKGDCWRDCADCG